MKNELKIASNESDYRLVKVRHLAFDRTCSNLLSDAYSEEMHGTLTAIVAPQHEVLSDAAWTGEDAILVTGEEMSHSALLGAAPRAQVGVDWAGGRPFPVLLLADGRVGIGAEIVVQALVRADEILPIVFDCKDGFVVMELTVTERLRRDLDAVILTRDLLPTGPVDDCPDSPYSVRDVRYIDYA